MVILWHIICVKYALTSVFELRDDTHSFFAHFLAIAFVNSSLNLWNHMLVLCGPTYLVVNLSISCMEMDKRCAKDRNQTFLVWVLKLLQVFWGLVLGLLRISCAGRTFKWDLERSMTNVRVESRTIEWDVKCLIWISNDQVGCRTFNKFLKDFFKKNLRQLIPFAWPWRVYKFIHTSNPLILVALCTSEPYSEKEKRFGERMKISWFYSLQDITSQPLTWRFDVSLYTFC